MSLTTTKEQFIEALKEGKIVSVCREIFADQETPVGIYSRVKNGKAATFLLESASQGAQFARYSFIGAGSFGVLSAKDGLAEWLPDPESGISEDQLLPGGISQLKPIAALEALNKYWATQKHPVLPLTNGFVGFLGWESIEELFGCSVHGETVDETPRQMMSFVSELIIHDHYEGSLILVANVLNNQSEPDTDSLWADANERIANLINILATDSKPFLANKTEVEPQFRRVTERAQFLSDVKKIKESITSGETSQIVLSQRFEQDLRANSLEVYRVLRHNNPSPFLYLLDFNSSQTGSLSIVGSSPEALITVNSGRVITHPIAGSRPRGFTLSEDERLEEELLADQKEILEHEMLVELAQDDLSAICESGSIEISGYKRIERFSHVMHIVSTVSGKLKPGLTAIDAFKATFPAGTLSGAPKPRSLEIITELEPAARGVYGGVVGYFSGGGDADLAIAIRTATLRAGKAYVQAGAGVVQDSVPENEDQETINKAMAPLRAIAVAGRLEKLGKNG